MDQISTNKIPVNPDIAATLAPVTKELLEKTREPRHAYIVLEKTKHQSIKKDGHWIRQWTHGLMFINVENQPEQAFNLRDAIKRGAKIIARGNFPSATDRAGHRRELYKHHTSANGVNAFDTLAGEVDLLLGKEISTSKTISALERQLLEERAKNMELSKKLNGGSGNVDQNKSKEREDSRAGGSSVRAAEPAINREEEPSGAKLSDAVKRKLNGEP